MSSKKPDRSVHRVDKATKDRDRGTVIFLPPAKPSRPFLVVSAGLLAVWVCFLIVLYLTTHTAKPVTARGPGLSPTTLPSTGLSVPR